MEAQTFLHHFYIVLEIESQMLSRLLLYAVFLDVVQFYRITSRDG